MAISKNDAGSEKRENTPSTNPEYVTLSKAEIAFLNAVIEDIREEDARVIDGVSILVPDGPQAKFVKVTKKITKKITKATKYTWIITEFLGFAARAEMNEEQQAEFDYLCNLLVERNSLEDLSELKELLIERSKN